MSACQTTPPIPLTTAFSVPASCSATVFLTTYNLTSTIVTSPPAGAPFSSAFSFTSQYPTSDLSAYGVVAAFATDPPGGGPRYHDAACYPPRFGELRAAWFLDRDDRAANRTSSTVCGGPLTYYSPGLCPAGWRSTNVAVVVVTPTPATTSSSAEAVTKATCCPPAFTLPTPAVSSVPPYCESALSAPTPVLVADDAQTWTRLAAGTVRAEAVEVRWRAGDGERFAPGGPEGGGGGIVSGGAPAGGEGRNGGGRLSTGAKAGIGVGVGVACVGALAVGGLVLWTVRRRRAREEKGKGKEEDEGAGFAKGSDVVGELEGRRPATPELPAVERAVEMEGVREEEAGSGARGGSVRRANAVRREAGAGAMRREEDAGERVHEDIAELE